VRTPGLQDNTWRGREREIYFKVPHSSLWEHSRRDRLIGRGVPGVTLFLASVQFLCLASPRENIPGPGVRNLRAKDGDPKYGTTRTQDLSSHIQGGRVGTVREPPAPPPPRGGGG